MGLGAPLRSRTASSSGEVCHSFRGASQSWSDALRLLLLERFTKQFGQLGTSCRRCVRCAQVQRSISSQQNRRSRWRSGTNTCLGGLFEDEPSHDGPERLLGVPLHITVSIKPGWLRSTIGNSVAAEKVLDSVDAGMMMAYSS